MVKKTSLETLAAQMAAGFAKQGKELKDLTDTVGFVVKHMATKDDVARLDGRIDRLATKEQLFALQTQVNGIETQLRNMQHVKLHARVADLEEKVSRD